MSYEGTKSTGKIKELIGLKEDISQRNIIIIEDIIDTGNTLVEILKTLEKYDTSSVSIVSLLLKPDVYNKDINIDFIGKKFQIILLLVMVWILMKMDVIL